MKIGILGLGEENIALIKYFASIGVTNLTICDGKNKDSLKSYLDQIKDVKFGSNFGPDYLDNLDQFDIVFRTPGIWFLAKEIQDALHHGVEISSQTKLFFELCPCPIIGVTGTKGKGTTSTLIYEMLKQDNRVKDLKSERNVYLGGNIGNAPIEFIDKLTKNDIVVLELSSFQLQDLEKSPHVGVVLNIANDHLDKHVNRDEYVEAKTSIVSHQKEEDFAVINADYLTSIEFAAMTKAQVFWFSRTKKVDLGVWVRDKKEIVLSTKNGEEKIIFTKDILLRGEHNWENISAAACAAHLAGVSLSAITSSIQNFAGLEHRLEFVVEKNNVRYYNDSFSTNPDTTIAAIKSFTEPIVLIVGGSEKNSDYKELGQAIDESNVKTVIAIGVTGPRIVSEINNPNIEIISHCKNIDEVVDMAKLKAVAGDVVVFSPASASFDWFANYKERGKIFKNIVMGTQ